jgi:hypothetical protein
MMVALIVTAPEASKGRDCHGENAAGTQSCRKGLDRGLVFLNMLDDVKGRDQVKTHFKLRKRIGQAAGMKGYSG